METFKFDTTVEYLHAVTTRRRYGNTGYKQDYDFTLTHNMDEALTLARKGWTDGAAKAREFQGSLSETIATQHVDKGVWRNVRAGGSVRVPSYLQGRPDCFRQYKQVRETKFVTLVFVGGASSGVGPTTYLSKGAIVAAAVDLMESRNIRVKVVLAYGSQRDGLGNATDNIGELYVTLKESGESLDLDRIAFWLAHPSALRRIRFAFYETIADDRVRKAGNGRGHSTDTTYQGDIYIGKSHISDRTWLDLDKSIAYVRQVLAAKGIEL